jgi:hypothetical protein
MYTKCYSGNLKGRCHLVDLAIDERTILKWILEIGSEDVDQTNRLRMGF